MHSFHDAADREWKVRLSIGAVIRVKDEVPGGPDLLAIAAAEPGQPALATLLESDPALLCHVIFALIKPQADEAGVCEADFCERIDGGSFAAAAEAFWKELELFFRHSGRLDLCRLIEAQGQVRQSVMHRNLAQTEINLENVLDEMRKADCAARNPTPGKPSGSSPESADSTPILSHSAS